MENKEQYEIEPNSEVSDVIESVEKLYNEHSNEIKKSSSNSFWQWIQAFAIALIFAYVINVFVFERALVDGDSMYPTLENGQSLFEYKLNYFFNNPERGDIIVMEYNSGKYKSRFIPLPDNEEINYVKRVVGLPGETIDIKEDGYVYINGVKFEENYITNNADGSGITTKNGVTQFPLTLGEDEFFVMGDNREHSRDGRDIGPIKKSQIRGKVVAIILPFDDFKIFK